VSLPRRHVLGALIGAAVAGTGSLSPTLVRADSPARPPGEVSGAITGPRLLGQGRLRFVGLHVYDARLWIGERFDANDFAGQPLALELIYARRLVGQQIAERSLKEMQREPGISDAQARSWLAEMAQAFPDVAKGDRLTGVLVPGRAARFYFNGDRRREVPDADFARRFFGIWLSDTTSQPDLRSALLGRGS
jgi:hypothetical protein